MIKVCQQVVLESSPRSEVFRTVRLKGNIFKGKQKVDLSL